MTGQTAFDFLRTLHPEGIAPHHLLIWTVTGDMKRSLWFRSIESAVAFVETCQPDAIYFGVGLSPKDFGLHARCKADEIVALSGLFCDIDLFCPGVHDKPGLAPSIDEALRVLPEEFPPTIVWDTGHGIQAMWLFKERWELNSEDVRDDAAALSQRWYNYLAAKGKRLGYAVDPIHDLSRVLRLPGTTNRKIQADPRLVKVVENSERRPEPSDFEKLLDLLGVPELEVRSVDERGRIEYGDLRVTPGVELAPDLRQQLDALIENDSEFAQVWRREKRMPKDNTWSGHAQSIADRLAYAGFADQSIIDIVTLHRREHGDAGKRGPKRLTWFTKYTLVKARKSATEKQAREHRREERETKQKEVDEQEAKERALIAEVSASDVDARKRLAELLELDVVRLVQIGNDLEPGYRLELADGRVGPIPSLAAVTNFKLFDRYVWRFFQTALPAKARRQWRAVSIALARLIVVEDTGLGETEVLLGDLGEYFSQAYGTFFDEFPAIEYPDGPPPGRCSSRFPHTGLVRAETEQEFAVALRLLALPRKANLAAVGVYFLDKSLQSDVGGEVGRAVFKMPPLYNWLRKFKDRKYDAETLAKRLMAAGFQFRQTAVERGVRLKRVWRGRLVDGEVDDHSFVAPEERAAFGDAVHRAPVQ